MDVHLFLLIILSIMTNVAKCCPITGVNTVTSHRLLGSTYRNKTGMELSSCVSLCKSDIFCISANYDFISQYCELNENNAIMAPGSLKHWPINFYVYIERLPRNNPCSFISCQNGGFCEFDKVSLKISCRCRNGYKGRRCEVCGNGSLGLQDGRIPDISFTASSSKSTNLPYMARLNGPKSWMPQDHDEVKFLQIDLAPHRYIISKIAVSGDISGVAASPYKVKYNDRDGNWKTVGKEYSGSFAETLFGGPPYPGGIKSSTVDPPILSTVIRIYPQGSNPAYRLELYGCRLVQ